MAPRGTYLKAGPWRAELRALAGAGLSDRAVARELSTRFPGLRFTRRRVRHWRTRDLRRRLEAEATPRERHTLVTIAADRRRLYQLQEGWGHLLPREARDETGWQPGAWTPGVELRPREVQVLSELRPGPRTERDLAGALGLRHLGSHGRRLLWGLRRQGLVERLLRGPAPALWRLTGKATEGADPEVRGARPC